MLVVLAGKPAFCRLPCSSTPTSCDLVLDRDARVCDNSVFTSSGRHLIVDCGLVFAYTQTWHAQMNYVKIKMNSVHMFNIVNLYVK